MCSAISYSTVRPRRMSVNNSLVKIVTKSQDILSATAAVLFMEVVLHISSHYLHLPTNCIPVEHSFYNIVHHAYHYSTACIAVVIQGSKVQLHPLAHAQFASLTLCAVSLSWCGVPSVVRRSSVTDRWSHVVRLWSLSTVR